MDKETNVAGNKRRPPPPPPKMKPASSNSPPTTAPKPKTKPPTEAAKNQFPSSSPPTSDLKADRPSSLRETKTNQSIISLSNPPNIKSAVKNHSPPQSPTEFTQELPLPQIKEVYTELFPPPPPPVAAVNHSPKQELPLSRMVEEDTEVLPPPPPSVKAVKNHSPPQSPTEFPQELPLPQMEEVDTEAFPPPPPSLVAGIQDHPPPDSSTQQPPIHHMEGADKENVYNTISSNNVLYPFIKSKLKVSDDKERVSDHDEGDKQQKDVKNPTQGEEISGIIVDKAKNDYTVLKSDGGYEKLKQDNAYENILKNQNESIYDVPVPSEYDIPSIGASLEMTSQDENPYETISGSMASPPQEVKGILPQSEAFRNYPWFDGEATPEKAQDELKRRDEEGTFMVINGLTDFAYLILAYHHQSIIPLLITKDEADDYTLADFDNQGRGRNHQDEVYFLL